MEIKGVDFKELPLNGIEFAFNANEIIVTCAHRDQNAVGAEPLKMYFSGVKNIFTDHFEMASGAEVKILDLELEESSESKKARVQLSSGDSKTEIVLTFNFSALHHSW